MKLADDMAVSCGSCLAFHADPAPSAAGECRRYAPSPATTSDFVWPIVDADDWCMQHRQREAPFGLTFVPSDAPIESRAADDD